jgi:hypothetical protein
VVVDGGERQKLRKFFRLLRERQVVQTFSPAVAARPKKKSKPKPKTPVWDPYPFHRFGSLYVQHYIDKEAGVLKAWCVCGEWCEVTIEQLNKGATACPVCRMDGWLDKAVEISESLRRKRLKID